jgi:hypothetical protein
VGEVERHLLDPLRMLAPRENICVWASVHVNKTATAAGMLRIALSRQVTDTAWSVGSAVEDPRDDPPGWRWRALAKINLGATPPAYRFTLVDVVHPSDEEARPPSCSGATRAWARWTS